MLRAYNPHQILSVQQQHIKTWKELAPFLLALRIEAGGTKQIGEHPAGRVAFKVS